ncbi:MAG: hypothetical protein ACLFTU_08210 [Puniceicoccaceae bacterium]
MPSLRFPLGLCGLLVSMSVSAGGDYFLADRPAQLHRADGGADSARRLTSDGEGRPADAAVLDFAVSRDGAVAVLSAATNLAPGVEAWDGPQVFLKESGGDWELISRDPESGRACGAFAPLLFLDSNGDGMQELIFEAGPSFEQNGSVAPHLRGYVGPIAYDRAGAAYAAFLPGDADSPQASLAVETRGGGILIRSASAAVASAAGLPGEPGDRWYRRDGGGAWTYLEEAGPGGPGFAFWRAHLSGFSEDQLNDDAISGPEADPDGDAVVNAIEAATGGDALVRDARPLRLLPDGDSLRLLVRQPPAGAAARLLDSDDLADWWPTAGQGVDASPRWQSGARWLEYRLSLPGDDPRWFFRLQAP